MSGILFFIFANCEPLKHILTDPVLHQLQFSSLLIEDCSGRITQVP